MGKLYLKKNLAKLPKIIIVEGFWGMGKTKLIDYLVKKFNYFSIPEPNHVTENIRKDISRWYYKKHLERLSEAIKKIEQKIVMERSVISSVAFDYAKTNKLPPNYQKNLKKIRKLKDFLVIFLYGNKNFVRKKAFGLKDFSVKRQLLNNPNFYRNYINFYKNILPPLIGNKITFVKVSDGNTFNKFSNIIKKLKLRFMAKDRDYQINGIVFKREGKSIKDVKFLLLKRIPQKGGFWQSITGGAFFSEEKIKALKRELKEEANIEEKGIKNIINTNYSFSFINENGEELREYVYGVEIDPGQKIIISKEHSEARWVDFKTALKLLKYESNKRGFRILYKILKNEKKVIL